MHETPNLMDANAVEPIPMNGSSTTLHLFTPCSLMHISGSLLGKVEGCGLCFLSQIVSYGINQVLPQSLLSPVAVFQRPIFVLS